MPSASSNRYQSRLFSFIHKQSRFLTNRLNRAWKTVTSWIAPVVFYPSLPQESVKQNLHQLPKSESAPPTVDTPIKTVMLLVDDLSSKEEIVTRVLPKSLRSFWQKFFPKVNTLSNNNFFQLQTRSSIALLEPLDNDNTNSLVQNRPKVRGIASLISNRWLVLVTPHNEILDILTSQQQQLLQERIITEVSQYWRWQKLLQSRQDTIKQIQLPARQSWLLAPRNLFSSVVNWSKDKQQSKLSFFPQAAIASLDRSIAKFETDNLAPIADRTKAFRIQGLIWAAIDYFFGDRNNKLPQLNQAAIADDNDLADPWLTMSDLFGSEVAEQSLILENTANSTFSYLPENKNSIRSSQELNKYSLRNLREFWRQLIQINSNKKLTSLSVKSPQPATNLTKIKRQETSITSPKVILSSPITNSSRKRKAAIETNLPSLNLGDNVGSKSSERLNHTPDWIETNATTMGYVKHPLEQLLEWLDRAMLWLENMLLKFWQWLQQR